MPGEDGQAAGAGQGGKGFTCRWCRKTLKSRQGLGYHEARCKKRPEAGAPPPPGMGQGDEVPEHFGTPKEFLFPVDNRTRLLYDIAVQEGFQGTLAEWVNAQIMSKAAADGTQLVVVRSLAGPQQGQTQLLLNRPPSATELSTADQVLNDRAAEVKRKEADLALRRRSAELKAEEAVIEKAQKDGTSPALALGGGRKDEMDEVDKLFDPEREAKKLRLEEAKLEIHKKQLEMEKLRKEMAKIDVEKDEKASHLVEVPVLDAEGAPVYDIRGNPVVRRVSPNQLAMEQQFKAKADTQRGDVIEIPVMDDKGIPMRDKDGNMVVMKVDQRQLAFMQMGGGGPFGGGQQSLLRMFTEMVTTERPEIKALREKADKDQERWSAELKDREKERRADQERGERERKEEKERYERERKEDRDRWEREMKATELRLDAEKDERRRLELDFFRKELKEVSERANTSPAEQLTYMMDQLEGAGLGVNRGPKGLEERRFDRENLILGEGLAEVRQTLAQGRKGVNRVGNLMELYGRRIIQNMGNGGRKPNIPESVDEEGEDGEDAELREMEDLLDEAERGLT